MRTHAQMQRSPAPIRAIAQEALRAAVHAPTEQEGFDVLADGLRRIGDLSAGAPILADRSPAQRPDCHVGDLAILSTRSETRVVRIKGRAADLCYDWKVEVLGSPIWAIDARDHAPAFTNLAFAMDCQLSPLLADVEEVDFPDDEEVSYV